MKRFLAGLGLALYLAGCAGDAPTAPVGTSLLTASSGPTLIECPTNVTRSTQTVIGPLGGSVVLGPHRVDVPPGAVLVPTAVTLTEPASQYVELALRADGLAHFEFLLPIQVTIGYERCSRSNLDRVPLTAWYITDLTHQLLEFMGGVDDKVARTVTFPTIHFSGYAIAQ